MDVGREQCEATLHSYHFIMPNGYNGLVHTHLFERPERCHHTEMHPQPAKRYREKKNIRNEMRQATLVENLYKCLFVADVVEIYKNVCVCCPSQHGRVMHTESYPKSITCGHWQNWYAFASAAMANDVQILFSVINSGMWKIEKETNATDEKSNGFHQSFY